MISKNYAMVNHRMRESKICVNQLQITVLKNKKGKAERERERYNLYKKLVLKRAAGVCDLT